ncbi:ATP-binding cassette domain-containing protein [Arthrobacter sp. P2b]|uniref:ATP-binding cassette domain-containing protein n=1 Tax=Arthrobacter sp. P2b TaxID=1938741 RepID=UPI0009C55A25|nr:ATP-binding cassette domain-containing protein [Arthrobacter sp. P2b]SLJ96091.1 ribose transport system ATP-binding protein [Arthrobacter sp. P2b]
MTDQALTVECRGLTKRYGLHTALDGVDLAMREGEFIALLGPNGAGKSTLIKLLDGVLTPDGGSVRFADGVSAGVIHQDLGLFDDMTVAENLFMGRDVSKHLISPTHEYRASAELLEFVGLTRVNPQTLLRDLSLGERALVATAKLWSQGAGVIIVDEVTASLPRAEASWLVEHLKIAARSGATVVMVSHRLEDLLGNVDRYMVFVDGQIAMDAPAEGVKRDELVRVMSSGRDQVEVEKRDVSARPRGEIVVELNGASVNKIRPLSLELREGWITGVSGSSVSGFHDAGYLVAGVARAQQGTVKVRPGTKVTCLPAHRDVDGTFPDQSVEFNMSVGNTNRWRKFGLINLARMRSAIATAAKDLNVIPSDTEAVITTLSGGNQQKALLGRVVADDPDCVVLCEPTRGVDVATRREIYSFVKKLANQGCAVMVVSSDMEDLASLADRIVVIDDDGRVERWVESDDVAEYCTARSALG